MYMFFQFLFMKLWPVLNILAVISIHVTLFQYFYKKNLRPKFNDDVHFCYVDLIERCWSHEPEKKTDI